MTVNTLRLATQNDTTWQYPVTCISGSPPESPSNNDRFLVISGTGAWVGKDNNIATYSNGWSYTSPKDGMYVYDTNTDLLLKYNSSTTSYLPATKYVGTNPPVLYGNSTLWYSTTDNMLFAYDSTRSKWLSIDRRTMDFTKSGNVTGQTYLRINGDAISSTTYGYLLSRPGVIIGYILSASSGDTSRYLTMTYNSDSTTQTTWQLNFNSSLNSNDLTINKNIHNGKIVYATSSSTGSTLSDVFLEVIVAWRPSNV